MVLISSLDLPKSAQWMSFSKDKCLVNRPRLKLLLSFRSMEAFMKCQLAWLLQLIKVEVTQKLKLK
jgi:hypothetical protein